jgi:predicted tellurium resistance membrane protein TerC
MMALLTDPSAWVAFATLTVLEIVLGIDNIIFLAILVGRLPPERQKSARITGLALAMLTRIALLFSIVWLIRLTQPWFGSPGAASPARPGARRRRPVLAGEERARDPLHARGRSRADQARVFANYALIVLQIAIIDIVFSLDSVFTAVGLARPDQVP